MASDPDSVRAAIGVTGQFSAVDNLLTGEENLRLTADLNHLSGKDGKRAAADLLERFDLTDAARKPASTYSGGMRRRLDLAMTAHSDGEALALRVPNDGSLRSLKALLDRLDNESIEVDGLSVHTPDLDDVFLALTGDIDNEKVTTR